MSSNETRLAKDILLDAAAETGWNTDSMLELACRWIDAESGEEGNGGFADFIEDQKQQES